MRPITALHTALALLALAVLPAAHANDSTGFIGTGGIRYLHNPHIAMQSEDLFISERQIRVAYRFQNLSRQDIRETVLFPLPLLQRYYEGDFADTDALIDSFRIQADGKTVKPDVHVRAYMYRRTADGSFSEQHEDVTDALLRCGIRQEELISPWKETRTARSIQQIHRQLKQCREPQIVRLYHEDELTFPWAAQVVYSWQQTFPAGKTVEIKHQYTPLVGGAIYFDARKTPDNTFYTTYCIDDRFRKKMRQSGRDFPGHKALSYILTTGANWAKPIDTFTLTIERQKDELVSLCWDNSLKQISDTRFQAVKRHFVPKRDLDIIFVPAAPARSE